MTFQFGGKLYELGFQRTKQSMRVPDPFIVNVKHIVVPKTPNKTTARLVEFEEDLTGRAKPTGLMYSGETLCKAPDRFNLEEGRLRALKLLTKKVPLAMRKPLWDSYLERPRHNEWLSKKKLAHVLYGHGFDEATIKNIFEASR